MFRFHLFVSWLRPTGSQGKPGAKFRTPCRREAVPLKKNAARKPDGILKVLFVPVS
jgi:hypothetical protein